MMKKLSKWLFLKFRSSGDNLFHLRNELFELEEIIKDENAKYMGIKIRVDKNDQVIENLINGVLTAKIK
jgi:hypothetical protein